MKSTVHTRRGIHKREQVERVPVTSSRLSDEEEVLHSDQKQGISVQDCRGRSMTWRGAQHSATATEEASLWLWTDYKTRRQMQLGG